MKIKKILLSVLSGVLLCFSFPNFIQPGLVYFSWFFIWFAFLPLFYAALEGDKAKDAMIQGMIAGSVFYIMSLYWLQFVGPMGVFAYVSWITLSLYLAVWLAVPLYCAKAIKQRFNTPYLVSLPALLTIGEYIREWLFTGFPLLTPAQSIGQFLPLLQLLKITGIPGLNYIIYFVNTFLFMLVSGKTAELKRKDALPSYIFTALLIGAVFAANAAFPDLKTTGKLMKAAVLQPDINQDVEWTSKYKDETLNVFKEMMLQARAQSPDVYIWPETGYPGIFNADPFGPAEVASWAGPKAYNIVGSDSANYRNGEMNYYNSVFVLTPGAAISGMYSKMHLVPFGEYVPFSDTLKFVHKVVKRYGFVGFESGKKIEPLILNGVSAAPLVCYDGLFPEIGREFALKGADFFTHLSYESWYGRTPASAQIFTNTALRSVENDLYLARSVASGISGIVSNTGRITANTGLFKKEVLVGDIYVKPGKAKTPYTKYGDWFVLLCAALVVLMCIRGIKK